MNRHEYRIKIVTAIYQHLLLKKDLKICIIDTIDEIDDFVRSIEADLLENEEKYIETINCKLNHWKFDRLNCIDRAILLEATSEYYLKLNDKKVVIDEAIRIAKEYSDEDSYKYINGVLDNL